MIPEHELRRLRALGRTQAELERIIERRLGGYPLQYLEGTVDFGPVTVKVDERVLIPRPETEYLADTLVRRLPPQEVVVDLGTGSGALAIFLKLAWPAARVIGTDISEAALEVARSNDATIEWRLGDLFGGLPSDLRGNIALLVANPPYIAESEWAQLPIDVRHEPRLALVAGPTGTEVIEAILRELSSWLAPRGEAWIEIGETQGWLTELYPVEVHLDQYGRDRYLRWKN